MIKDSICNKCSMYKLNKPKVFYDISGIPNILFLGANPGYNEVKLNKPFVGNSGKILRSNIDKYFKDNYIIFNSILCYTNNTSEIIDLNNTIKICSYYWYNILKEYNTIKTIIALGNIAIKSIKYKFNIKGNFKPSKFNNIGIYEGYNILSIPHPSYILRGGLSRKEYEVMFEIIKRRIKNVR